MPFDPAIPAQGSDLSSAELRAQLTALHDDIQTRAQQNVLNDLIAGTAANVNTVSALNNNSGIGWSSGELQIIADKLDELILALRR